MTIGAWITIIVLGFIGLAITAGCFLENPMYGVIALLVTLIICGATFGVFHWYFNNTASGARALKDQESELNNGLKREIIITAEDGREIFYYRGKCDIETNDGYILFEDEEGLRYMIYYGVCDTVVIAELPY